MIAAPWTHLDRFRLHPPGHLDSPAGADFGAFAIPHAPTNVLMRVIASGSDGTYLWEHVSVSLPNRTPNWREMEFACRLFWREDEAVMQLHPPRSDWVNNHPFCLHLWRPANGVIPLPPQWMVGVAGMTPAQTQQAVDMGLVPIPADAPEEFR